MDCEGSRSDLQRLVQERSHLSPYMQCRSTAGSADCRTETHWIELSCEDTPIGGRRAAEALAKELNNNYPQPNPNRSRQSAAAKTLTFEAQTGRGSDTGYVITRTQETRYSKLIKLVHSLAQSTPEAVLPYLGFQILKLEKGQDFSTR